MHDDMNEPLHGVILQNKVLFKVRELDDDKYWRAGQSVCCNDGFLGHQSFAFLGQRYRNPAAVI
jgi:hypothetical protein